MNKHNTLCIRRRATARPTRPLALLLLAGLLALGAPALAQQPDAKPAATTAKATTEKAEAKDEKAPEPGLDPKAAAGPRESAPGPSMAPTLPKDATPEQRRAYEAYQQAFLHYSRETGDYQKTVDGIVDAKYRQRIARINERYERRINEQAARERITRNDAIAAFERFIARYPRSARYSPDALFRLAELYFEKANDDFLLADEQYQDKVAQYEAGRIPDMPPEPKRDYSKTVDTFSKLIRDWPEYRFIDGAYYLLAYCEQQRQRDEVAKELYVMLIQRRPDSQFVPEAWIRVGEYFFDINELTKAREAYAEATKFPKSRFYDKALYKLAWTYYRQDAFDSAIAHFKQLVEYSDKREAETGQSGSVLRSEAVQYIAISLAEEDWNLDGIQDDDFGLERAKRYLPGDRPFQRDSLSQLVDYMFDQKRWDVAIDIIRYTLQTFPLHPENPQLHEQLVQALLRKEDTNGAFTERRNLSAFYGPGSTWYDHQQKVNNADAMRYANELVRDGLNLSARWFHKQASTMREDAEAKNDPELAEAARKKYADAATAYADFLKKYPNDKDNYKWTFYYADCLYYSAQYEDAYKQYRVVRETDLIDKQFLPVQEESALYAIKSLEERLKEKVRLNKLKLGVLPSEAQQDLISQGIQPPAEQAAPAGPPTVQKVDPLVTQYVTAIDRYVVLGFQNPQDPLLDSKYAFHAARIYYDYNDFPEARRRFDWLIKTYPKEQVAEFSVSLIVETYRLQKDYAGMAAAAEKYKNVLPKEAMTRLNTELTEQKLRALFKAAEKDMAEGRYEEAVKKYSQVVSQDKKREFTVKALHNTAVAYEQLKRPGPAMDYYERVYREFPEHPYAAYGIFRVAVNADKFFEFERAAKNYLIFYERFGKKSTPKELQELKIDFAKVAPDALRSASLLLYDMQRYSDAATRYEEYASTYRSNEDAAAVQWQAILAWDKAKNTRKYMAAIDTYLKYFGADNHDRALEAMMLKADYHAERKNQREVNRWYNKILSEYASRGVAPGSEGAEYAAKAQFMLIEQEFAKWDAIQFKTSLNQQKKDLPKKQAGLKTLFAEYAKVFAYNRLTWVMAAGFRQGYLYQRFARALYDAKVPFAEGSEEYDLYRAQLDDIAVPLEDEAIKLYKAILGKAQAEKVVNEWTKLTLQQLNQYRPAEYPIYKEERQALEEQPQTSGPLLDAERYQLLLKPADPKR